MKKYIIIFFYPTQSVMSNPSIFETDDMNKFVEAVSYYNGKGCKFVDIITKGGN